MEILRKLGRVGMEITNMADMVYAYRKGMPLMKTEMALRQNVETLGELVPINEENTIRGAWLILTKKSFFVQVLEKTTRVTLFDAWNNIILEMNGPTEFVISYSSPSDLLLHGPAGTVDDGYGKIAHSPTVVARLVFHVLHVEDEPDVRRIDAYSNLYSESTIPDIAVRSKYPQPIDPKEMSAREFFTVLSSTIISNPPSTPDSARILRGVKLTDGATSFALERVKSIALLS